MNDAVALIRLPDGWRGPLAPLFAQPEMQRLKDFLSAERVAGKRIYPNPHQWFAALDSTPLDAVRVVILGQDPYHGAGQANGLAFSVQPGVRIPPSLANIYKELAADLGVPPVGHGHLAHWAKQGVLLLNTVLTVEEARAASHRGKGWETLTDAVIDAVSRRLQPVVFLLWGNHAQKKAARIDKTRHHVLMAPHPSPLSAHTGFFGSRPFSRANAFLEANGLAGIDWTLPETP
jgi:uracil-DNA glycosylase